MQCGPPGLLNELIAKLGFFYALALLFLCSPSLQVLSAK